MALKWFQGRVLALPKLDTLGGQHPRPWDPLLPINANVFSFSKNRAENYQWFSAAKEGSGPRTRRSLLAYVTYTRRTQQCKRKEGKMRDLEPSAHCICCHAHQWRAHREPFRDRGAAARPTHWPVLSPGRVPSAGLGRFEPGTRAGSTSRENGSAGWLARLRLRRGAPCLG